MDIGASCHALVQADTDSVHFHFNSSSSTSGILSVPFSFAQSHVGTPYYRANKYAMARGNLSVRKTTFTKFEIVEEHDD